MNQSAKHCWMKMSFVISKRFADSAIADIDLNVADGISDIKAEYPEFFNAVNDYLKEVVSKE